MLNTFWLWLTIAGMIALVFGYRNYRKAKYEYLEAKNLVAMKWSVDEKKNRWIYYRTYSIYNVIAIILCLVMAFLSK